MRSFEFLIKESDVAHNTKTVREDSKFIGIAEMTIDALLFGIGAGSSGWGHKSIGHFVRVNLGIILVMGFQPSNEGIKGFWVIFGNIKLNPRSVKGKGLG